MHASTWPPTLTPGFTHACLHPLDLTHVATHPPAYTHACLHSLDHTHACPLGHPPIHLALHMHACTRLTTPTHAILRYGGDLPDGLHQLGRNGSSSQCAALCHTAPLCTAYVVQWCPDNTTQCYLKKGGWTVQHGDQPNPQCKLCSQVCFTHARTHTHTHTHTHTNAAHCYPLPLALTHTHTRVSPTATHFRSQHTLPLT
jgi:hypothetical protein